LQDRLEFITVSRNKVKKLATQHDHATLRKAKLALEYRNLVAKIRACHEDLLEAQIRFIEADSDVAALSERNQDIVRQLAEEKQKVKDAEEDSKIVKQKAQRALSVVKEILANPDNEPYTEQFQNFPPGTTVESLEMEIAAEESKLEFIHANNPNAIRDFEQRQLEVEALQGKIANNDEKLENISRRITKIRSKWEPELDKLIATISDAFSYNFEQIGCAGEVGVHKDDDFENWAIQIKVKFR
jgi:chromosome segregation ATPase